MEDFRPINQNFTSDICYLLSHTLIKLSVFVVCGLLFFMEIFKNVIMKKVLTYFKVNLELYTFQVFSAIAIMACKVRTLCHLVTLDRFRTKHLDSGVS